jgi:hypothetical protein
MKKNNNQQVEQQQVPVDVGIKQPEIPSTMINPFTLQSCNVKRLQPGDVVEANDIYRSSTLREKTSEAGVWCLAGNILAGSIVGDGMNVALVRLTPVK